MEDLKVRKKHYSRFVMPVFLLGFTICVLGASGLLFVPRLRTSLNRQLWESSEPKSYHMTVTEMRPDGGPWKWSVYVQNGHAMTTTVLETGGQSSASSWLEPDRITIEHVFEIADDACLNRGLIDCGINFDYKFHYPAQINSYQLLLITVEDFTVCEDGQVNCQ
jgi:hypothetical protein